MDVHSANMLVYLQKKKTLIKQLSALEGDAALSLKKTTSNLFRNRSSTNRKIDVRRFNQVIDVHAQAEYVDVEGMATYETIVAETLKHGVMPTVVPELKTITLGGALSGIGIESSSFRYGLVHETVLEFDVLLGDGRVITCSPTNEHQDLFFAFPNSYGTLGYALRVRVKTIPVKKYVKLTHLHFDNSKAFFDKMQDACKENRRSGNMAFIDGTAFSHKKMVLTLGEFVDNAPNVSNYKYMSIYYRSLQQKKTDYLTTHDYIWRWDTDWFWCSRFFGMQHFLPRLLLGKFLLHSKMYWKMMRFARNNKLAVWLQKRLCKPTESVIQDVELPIENSPAFFEFFFKEIPITPLWLCPIYAYDDNAHFSLFDLPKNKLMVNFGFWQAVQINQADGYYNKLIEQQVSALQGHKSLYSNVYYAEKEFWGIYDKPLYDTLKEKYDPNQSLKYLYNKVTEK